MNRTRLLTTMAVFVAIGTLGAQLLWFPAGVAKAYPVQHAVNVMVAVTLGPGPAVVIAFMIGLLRNMLGLGTLLAFPGGMIGAFLAGYLYKNRQNSNGCGRGSRGYRNNWCTVCCSICTRAIGQFCWCPFLPSFVSSQQCNRGINRLVCCIQSQTSQNHGKPCLKKNSLNRKDDPFMNKVESALTIAGTDPSGGAGIQADLKTFQELQTYGMSVITSVVAQNTTGVQDVQHMSGSMIKEQLVSVISDIPFQAFKTGMLANIEIMDAVAEKICGLTVPYVMDPVMVAASGDPLISDDAQTYLCEKLLPLTTVTTPNIPEAEAITGQTITTPEDMQQAAKQIVHDFGASAALVKGGHMRGKAVDFLYDGDRMHTFSADRIDTKTHMEPAAPIQQLLPLILVTGIHYRNP